MRVLGLAVLILLAGCEQPTAEKQPPPETQAPATAPEAEAKPELKPVTVVTEATLPPAPKGGVTIDGWGVVRVGMTLEELNAALGERLDPNDDPDFAEYQCTYFYPKGAPDGLSIMYAGGNVARINVEKAGVATYAGLQVGSTAAEAREAFGGALNAQPHYYIGLPAEYLTVWTRGGPPVYRTGMTTAEETAVATFPRGLRFETDEKGVIEEFYAGDGAIELVEGCL